MSDSRSERRGVLFQRRTKVYVVAAICLVAIGGAAAFGLAQPGQGPQGRPRSGGSQGPTAPPPPAAAPGEEVAAVVNGSAITKADLGRDCLRHFGEDVLASLVNKLLIAQYCNAHKVVVTRQEVDSRIEETARRFGLPKDEFLKMLETERGIKPVHYANDIIWPTLAMEKVAAPQLKVSAADIQEMYESYYGEAVQARIIVLDTAEEAEKTAALARNNPDEFGNLAKEHSVDVNSASARGLIQPIHRHQGDPAIEEAAFGLAPGQVSAVIPVGSQFVILKCERRLPAQDVDMASVKARLQDEVKDGKLRSAADELFASLQKEAKIENIFNDPQKSREMPGIAAIINGRQITVAELTRECYDRYALQALEGVISRRILEQAVAAKKVAITKQDMDAEIARAAVAMGVVDTSGNADMQAWLQTVQQEYGQSYELYQYDVVWPTVALKKLVGASVQVTEDDLLKGYEANYGPRVRCRAIVLDNQRRAQEVWDKARKNPTSEFFGDLAAEYSIEAGSRQLRGEVPPVQKHGGQPVLEREAFSLAVGELSGVIQVGDKFVILLCEGYTQPAGQGVPFEEVRDLIYADVMEKKLRIEMDKEFARLQGAAKIENRLASTPAEDVPASRTGRGG
jgi:parvulin-like peptidyl-prolyl isomerase